jgi:hypothetical protein
MRIANDRLTDLKKIERAEALPPKIDE